MLWASEGINIICHYWYLRIYKTFTFQTTVSNSHHDILTMSTDITSIVILDINGVDYCFTIVGITKIEKINLIANADLSEKSGSLQIIIFVSSYMEDKKS